MDFSPEQIRNIFQALLFLVLSICVHEYGHAIVADKLGDRLPRRQGRTSLNPLVHADPIGTFAFPLLGLLASGGHGTGFGWGKPVQVMPTHFTRKLRMRTAHMLVAAAGPAMNLLLGVLVSITHLIVVKAGWAPASGVVSDGFMAAAMLNFGLALFNCIPAPPLDGGTIVEGLLPHKYLASYHKYAVYGPFVLMAFLMIRPLREGLGEGTAWLYFHWAKVIGLAEEMHWVV